MKRTKLLALALAGVMTLALLTGCSDSSSKAKQVEEYFRYRMRQFGDYQKDETLDKKLEVIAQKFQPDWLASGGGGGDRLCLALVWRSEAGPEYADAGGEYEAMRYGRVYYSGARNKTGSHSLYNDGREE